MRRNSTPWAWFPEERAFAQDSWGISGKNTGGWRYPIITRNPPTITKLNCQFGSKKKVTTPKMALPLASIQQNNAVGTPSPPKRVLKMSATPNHITETKSPTTIVVLDSPPVTPWAPVLDQKMKINSPTVARTIPLQ